MAVFSCCVGWLLAGLLAGTLLSWLLHSLVPSPGAPSGAATTSGTSGDTARRHADQLEAVEGIGSKTAEVFRRHGIVSFDDLARKTPDALRAILHGAGHNFDGAQPETWPRQARLLADGDILGFVAYIRRLRGGVEPSTSA
jgi:hypothetical protein